MSHVNSDKDLLLYLTEHLTKYLDELVYWLYEEYQIAVHASTIYRVLKRRGWSHTKAHKEAAERDAGLCATFRDRQDLWDVNKVVCVDESASNQRTGY